MIHDSLMKNKEESSNNNSPFPRDHESDDVHPCAHVRHVHDPQCISTI